MTFRTTRRTLLAGVLGLSSICLGMAPTKAVMITINSVTKLAGDSSNFSVDNVTNAGEWQSATSTLSSGANTPDVVNAAVTGSTRYASVLGSDAGPANFGSRSDSATSSYRVTFTVTPQFALSTYSLKIDTARRGALVNRDEGGAAGSETINGVTGSFNNAVTGTLALPGLPTQSSNATVVTNINQTSTSFNVVGLQGTQVFTLDFTWTQSTNSGNNILSGGDEAVVLLGLVGPQSSFGASDDYPGTSGHTQANDGHFVTIQAKITALPVPEPGTFVLAGVGAVGLVAAGYRRRYKS